MAPRTILDLPDELLLQLPGHMRNIEDFMNASSTCKRLRSVFADTLPKQILHLAVQSAPTFFSPHPHFLAISVARQIPAWAVAVEAERERRTQRLVDSLRGGVAGILDLALSEDADGVGLTMQDVRRMHELRFRVINPLSDTVDAMIGSAWYAQPNFWSGGASDAFTLDADSNTATMQLLLYGELFGATMNSYLRPAEHLPALGVDVRVEFVKYCIPDWICEPGHRHDGFQVLAVGPYAKDGKDEGPERLHGDQTALAHLFGGAMFGGTLWKRAWRRVLIAAGASENEDGRWPKRWRKSIEKMECRREQRGESSVEESSKEEDEAEDMPEAPTEGLTEDQQGANDVDEDQERSEAEGDTQGEEVGPNEEGDAGENIETVAGTAVAEENDGDEINEADVGDDEDGGDEEDEGEESEQEQWEYSSQDTETRAANENQDLEHLPGDWRFKLFWTSLAEIGGLNTFEMVAQFKGREAGKEVVMKPEWKAKILQIRDQVLALKEEDAPGHEKFGKRTKLRISQAPDPAIELYWCCCGMWGGL